MKKYIKASNEYNDVEFDADKIKASMKRLKNERKVPTSVALKRETIMTLKAIADQKGIPYQVLMRMFILEGLKKENIAA